MDADGLVDADGELDGLIDSDGLIDGEYKTVNELDEVKVCRV